MTEVDRLAQAEVAAEERGLHKDLTRAQIVMIGLGGAIGTGLFMGSGLAIGYAGPSVIISYLLAAFAATVMVFSLSEMAVVHPAAGSFGVYAETYLNPWAGFVVRYTYWVAQVIAIGGEAIAAGLYMSWWFPGVPVWVWSLAFSLILLWVNSRSVGNFGTIEYWFAFIKVAAISVFIILGGAAIFGVGQAAVGFHNLTGLPGGFFPNGLHGTWMAVIMGLFSFNGIELIAVTSGETKDPRTAIPAALRTMALRLALFYLLALTIVVSFIPWTETGAKVVAQSPFVKVFEHSGIIYAAGIMNFVVISAALSSMNTNVYLATRMLFSLSRGGHAPKALGRLNSKGSPIVALVLSGACILVSAGMSMFTPKAYSDILGVALFGAMFVWIVILLSHLGFRRAHKGAELPVRMPFFPVMQIAGLLLVGAVLVTMGLDKDWNLSWKFGVPWLVLISLAYFLTKLMRPRTAPAAAE
jgi:AAT family amino acid transporter